MRDNDYRDVESHELSHSGEGFRLKRGVADGEDFIDNQDVRLEVRGHCKPEPRLHAARVPLDRRIDEGADLGELHDLVELARDSSISARSVC